MQIDHFSLDYYIIDIQRQNSVKFYTSIDILSNSIRRNLSTGFQPDPLPQTAVQAVSDFTRRTMQGIPELRAGFEVTVMPWWEVRRSKHSKQSKI